jgi:carboxypeptidase family protein/PEGA domain-containing protein
VDFILSQLSQEPLTANPSKPPAPGGITVRLFNEQNKVLGDVQVQVLSPDGSTDIVKRTGRDGRFIVNKLPVGHYSVKVAEPPSGYLSGEAEADVGAGKRAIVEIQLKEKRLVPLSPPEPNEALGDVIFETPVPGAEVKVDGGSKGLTRQDRPGSPASLRVNTIRLGTHRYEIIPPSPQWAREVGLFEAKVPLENGATGLKVLHQAVGSLYLVRLLIQSTPPGASILLDNGPKGKTPNYVLLWSGTHDVSLALSGCSAGTKFDADDRHPYVVSIPLVCQ